jgi:hypothetical protein
MLAKSFALQPLARVRSDVHKLALSHQRIRRARPENALTVVGTAQIDFAKGHALACAQHAGGDEGVLTR